MTSFRLCEMTMTAMPWDFSRRIRSSTTRVWVTPRAAVGSSMITSRAWRSTALATATAWRWLPDRADRHHRQVGQGALGCDLHRGLVQHPVPERLPAEEHVLHDVEVVGQRQVLVDGGDAQIGGILRRVKADRVALPENRAV